MTRRSWILLLGGAACGQISPAHVGYVLDKSNRLRRVFGVAGAFTIGPVVDEEILSAAFSGSSLVVKKHASLLVDGRSFRSPEGSATVVFDAAGQVSEIFFPDAAELWTWHAGRFESCAAAGLVSDVIVRGDELIVSGLPVRLPRSIRQVSQLGQQWLVVYCDEFSYAVREGKVYELPEADA